MIKPMHTKLLNAEEKTDDFRSSGGGVWLWHKRFLLILLSFVCIALAIIGMSRVLFPAAYAQAVEPLGGEVSEGAEAGDEQVGEDTRDHNRLLNEVMNNSLFQGLVEGFAEEIDTSARSFFENVDAGEYRLYETGAIKDGELAGAWGGDCSGAGSFVDHPDDIWKSRTGCYNPAERFVYNSTTVELVDPRNPNTQPAVGVPRDDLLLRHPLCVAGKTPESLAELDNDPDFQNINCLNDNYLQDFDNICDGYIGNSKRFVKKRWMFKDGCWTKEEQPLAIAEDPLDHWLPLAASPRINLTPFNQQTDKLGEYGFRNVRIARDDYPYSQANIYNYSTPPTNDPDNTDAPQIRDINNWGVKAKRFECLKIYNESWAHAADCQGVVIQSTEERISQEALNATKVGNTQAVSASYVPNEGLCQWVTMYNAKEDHVKPNVISPAAVDKDGQPVDIGMRSEHYDYENFISGGWMPTVDEDGQQQNVCNKKMLRGTGDQFNAIEIDFAKRGCPTRYGPDSYWPDFWRTQCKGSYGANRINHSMSGFLATAFGAVLNIGMNMGLDAATDFATAEFSSISGMNLDGLPGADLTDPSALGDAFAGNLGLDSAILTDIVSQSATGAFESALTGGDPLSGALGGAAGGVFDNAGAIFDGAAGALGDIGLGDLSLGELGFGDFGGFGLASITDGLDLGDFSLSDVGLDGLGIENISITDYVDLQAAGAGLASGLLSGNFDITSVALGSVDFGAVGGDLFAFGQGQLGQIDFGDFGGIGGIGGDFNFGDLGGFDISGLGIENISLGDYINFQQAGSALLAGALAGNFDPTLALAGVDTGAIGSDLFDFGAGQLGQIDFGDFGGISGDINFGDLGGFDISGLGIENISLGDYINFQQAGSALFQGALAGNFDPTLALAGVDMGAIGGDLLNFGAGQLGQIDFGDFGGIGGDFNLDLSNVGGFDISGLGIENISLGDYINFQQAGSALMAGALSGNLDLTGAALGSLNFGAIGGDLVDFGAGQLGQIDFGDFGGIGGDFNFDLSSVGLDGLGIENINLDDYVDFRQAGGALLAGGLSGNLDPTALLSGVNVGAVGSDLFAFGSEQIGQIDFSGAGEGLGINVDFSDVGGFDLSGAGDTIGRYVNTDQLGSFAASQAIGLATGQQFDFLSAAGLVNYDNVVGDGFEASGLSTQGTILEGADRYINAGSAAQLGVNAALGGGVSFGQVQNSLNFNNIFEDGSQAARESGVFNLNDVSLSDAATFGNTVPLLGQSDPNVPLSARMQLLDAQLQESGSLSDTPRAGGTFNLAQLSAGDAAIADQARAAIEADVPYNNDLIDTLRRFDSPGGAQVSNDIIDAEFDEKLVQARANATGATADQIRRAMANPTRYIEGPDGPIGVDAVSQLSLVINGLSTQGAGDAVALMSPVEIERMYSMLEFDEKRQFVDKLSSDSLSLMSHAFREQGMSDSFGTILNSSGSNINGRLAEMDEKEMFTLVNGLQGSDLDTVLGRMSPDLIVNSMEKLGNLVDTMNLGETRLTTNINDQRSAGWLFTTGGQFGIPTHDPATGKASDWIDYSWPARDCMHMPYANEGSGTDTLSERFDYNADLQASLFERQADFDPATTPNFDPRFAPGFMLKRGVAPRYRIEFNTAQFSQGAAWCEFELPYSPFESGQTESQILRSPPGHVILNEQRNDTRTGEPQRMALTYKVVERIRDGCGAFSQRGTWVEDKRIYLTRWLLGRSEKRCEGWKGLYGRKYDDPKIVSWRLPRFDYEFLKAFIECTGPLMTAGQVKSKYPACPKVNPITLFRNCCQITFTGICCFPMCKQKSCRKQDNSSKPIVRNWNSMGAFGFWCDCKGPRFLPSPLWGPGAQTQCNENWCTCQQATFLPGVFSPPLRSYCGGYGPYRRWLQCYYSARSKACPVLTREISNGIAPSTALIKEPGKFSPEPEGVCTADQSSGDVPWHAKHLRWAAEEPNILARLPVKAESGGHAAGKSLKHHDLVFQSQTRDIEAPFIEPTVPFPLVERVDPITGDLDMQEADDNVSRKVFNANKAIANKALKVASDAFAHTEASTEQNPSPRAQEAVVGPRGCDIGGWYEMMLYQARCIKWFRLSCLCDYDKTFFKGSAEFYIQEKLGASVDTVEAKVVGDGKVEIVKSTRAIPYTPLGIIGPNYAKGAPREAFLLGMDNAEVGDVLIFDENVKEKNGENARYRRHVAYVEEVRRDESNAVDRVTVSEKNWGKHLDSCGNTDRWGTRTFRRIFKSESAAPGMVCEDPDWSNCWERNWDRIRIFRSSLDTRVDLEEGMRLPYGPRFASVAGQSMGMKPAPRSNRPVCSPEQMPQVIDAEDVCDDVDITAMNERELRAFVSSGKWRCLPEVQGYVSKDDYVTFLMRHGGKCVPPTSYDTVPKRAVKPAEIGDISALAGPMDVRVADAQAPPLQFGRLAQLALDGPVSDVAPVMFAPVKLADATGQFPQEITTQWKLDNCQGIRVSELSREELNELLQSDKKGCLVPAGNHYISNEVDFYLTKQDGITKIPKPLRGTLVPTSQIGQSLATRPSEELCADPPCAPKENTNPHSAPGAAISLTAAPVAPDGGDGGFNNGSLCEMFPGSAICEALDCMKNPSVQCCSLVDGAKLLADCASNPSPECCKLIPGFGGRICRSFTQCANSPGQSCCRGLEQVGGFFGLDRLTGFVGGACRSLASCDFSRPDASCCAGIAQMGGALGIPRGVTNLCAPTLNCLNNPSVQCCGLISGVGQVFGTDKRQAAAGAQVCSQLNQCDLSNPSAACCNALGKSTGLINLGARGAALAGTCSSLLNCVKNPSIQCCNAIQRSGGLGDVTGQSRFAAAASFAAGMCKAVNRCDLSGDNISPSCCAIAKQMEGIGLPPRITRICDATLSCMAKPGIQCCRQIAKLSPGKDVGSIIRQCEGVLNCDLSNPTADCCAAAFPDRDNLDESVRNACKRVHDCIENPGINCCGLGTAAGRFFKGVDAKLDKFFNFGSRFCGKAARCDFSNPDASCCGMVSEIGKFGASLISDDSPGAASVIRDVTGRCNAINSCAERPSLTCCNAFSGNIPRCRALLACAFDKKPTAKCCKMARGVEGLPPAIEGVCGSVWRCIDNPGIGCCGVVDHVGNLLQSEGAISSETNSTIREVVRDTCSFLGNCDFNNPDANCCKALSISKAFGVQETRFLKNACAGFIQCAQNPSASCCKRFSGLDECACITNKFGVKSVCECTLSVLTGKDNIIKRARDFLGGVSPDIIP